MSEMDSIRFPDQPSDPLESSQGDRTAAAIRDLAYELAGAKDRNLAVDVLVYATGLAEYETSDLRSYAARHGLSPEGFRKQVIALQRRLGLPPRARQVRHDN